MWRRITGKTSRNKEEQNCRNGERRMEEEKIDFRETKNIVKSVKRRETDKKQII